MKILIACEYSAIVRDAFRDKGHDAWSCDILETEGSPDYHIIGDVLNVLNDGWDMMIAHPPCTYLANSGVRWLYNSPHRWKDLIDGACFFRKLLEAPIPRIAIENPVIHGYAKQIIGIEPTQTFQPWQFGDNESKRICLWLKGLPKLRIKHTEPQGEVIDRVHKMPPGPDRQKERSRFFPSVAEAMACQWGAVC